MNSIDRAVSYLKKQHDMGYPALAHHLQLPAYIVYHPWRSLLKHPRLIQGDVFQRAMITESYLDLDSLGIDLSRETRENLDYLASLRDSDGWRYFPGMMELPTDIDDLGQIIQVMTRSGRSIDVDLRGVIQDVRGHISSWIGVDEKTTLKFNEGRQEADLAVMANFLYGVLHLPRSPKREEMIKRGVGFIATEFPKVKLGEGWYPNPMYTYNRINLLWEKWYGHKFEPAVNAAHSYLLAPNDPVTTALAILILGEDSTRQGREFLERTQQPDGSWLCSTFIRTKFMDYAHPVIATAYAVNALSRIFLHHKKGRV